MCRSGALTIRYPGAASWPTRAPIPRADLVGKRPPAHFLPTIICISNRSPSGHNTNSSRPVLVQAVWRSPTAGSELGSAAVARTVIMSSGCARRPPSMLLRPASGFPCDCANAIAEPPETMPVDRRSALLPKWDLLIAGHLDRQLASRTIGRRAKQCSRLSSRFRIGAGDARLIPLDEWKC